VSLPAPFWLNDWIAVLSGSATGDAPVVLDEVEARDGAAASGTHPPSPGPVRTVTSHPNGWPLEVDAYGIIDKRRSSIYTLGVGKASPEPCCLVPRDLQAEHLLMALLLSLVLRRYIPGPGQPWRTSPLRDLREARIHGCSITACQPENFQALLVAFLVVGECRN
jgi:hypothetical protein